MNIQLLPMRSINTGGPANYAGISKVTNCAWVERCPHGLSDGAMYVTVQFASGDLLLADVDSALTVPFGQQGRLL